MTLQDAAGKLSELNPAFDYLVAIDSDGCVFDNMGIKQRECFCPMMIACFGLQAVAHSARQCKEFADLFSDTRGANRHKTMSRILTELLPSHPDVKEKQIKLPSFSHYCQWADDPDSVLTNQGLKKAAESSVDPIARTEFETALKWSCRVDELVAEIVHNIPPFPYVRQSMKKISSRADIMTCSATPYEAIVREWNEHGIGDFPRVIAGQEMGTKARHLKIVTDGKYKPNHVLMVGDAPGDLYAARSVGAFFYPIIPGSEVQSWRRFHDEAFDTFINSRYQGDYQQTLIRDFESHLPETPPWL